MKKKAVFLGLILLFSLIFSGMALGDPSSSSDMPYTISGTISLPNGETAESGGLTLSLDASARNLSGPPQAGRSSYNTRVTIPEGESSASYSIGVNQPPSGYGYIVNYKIPDGVQTKYRPAGFYCTRFNGNSAQYPLATVLDVAAEGSFEGIDIIVAQYRTISGRVMLPQGKTAPPGGVKVKLTLLYGKEYNPGQKGCLSAECTVPEGANTGTYTFNNVSPNERYVGSADEIGDTEAQAYRLQYIVDKVSDIKEKGFLGNNATVEDYNQAMKINVTNGDKIGLTFLLLSSQNNPSQGNPGPSLKLRATSGDAYITLDWSAAANTTGLDGYYLYKGTSPGGEDASPMFDFPINALTYKDTQVTNGKTYYYILKPCYNQGTLMGSASNEASATPQGNKGGTIVLTIGNPNMKINGQTREIDPGKGTAPVIVSGRTFLPIRAVIEAMGGAVAWDNSARKVAIVLNKQTINLWIGKTTATVNGAAKNLDVAPYISNTGRTMIPLRFVTENLGCNVIWNGPEQTVTINYGK